MKSGRSHSWWWDSHISPKNSKWLEDSLKDMDTKVSAMLKLIEEDADSFAKRADMYYKKRPELVKMVEEFYRCYRSLAERYDNLTGAIRNNVQSPRSEVSGETSDESPFEKRIHFRRAEEDVTSPSICRKNGNDIEGADESAIIKKLKTGKKGLKKKKNNSSSSSSDSGSSSSDSDGDSDSNCSSKNDANGLQREKNILLKRSETQRQEEHAMESKLKGLQEQLDNFVTENKHLSFQVIEKNKFEEQVKTLEIEKKGLVANNTNLADALHEGSTQLRGYEQKIMQLEKLIRERNEESVKLKQELESQTGCSKLLEEQIVKLKSEVSSLHMEKIGHEQQIAKLQTEVNEALISNSHLSRTKHEVENQITQSEAKLQNLTDECIHMRAELLQIQEDRVTLRSELSKRNELLERSEEENKDLQKKERDMNYQIKCRTDQIERLQLHVSALEAEILALEKLKAALHISLHTLETECQKHMEAEQTYSSRVHTLEEDLSRMQEKRNNLDHLIVSKEREIRDLQELVSKMQKENNSLHDEILSESEEITDMKRELKNAQEEKNTLNERVQSKTEELLEVHATIKMLEKQFQEMQANYQTLEGSHQRGMDEKVTLEEALNKKQTDLAHLQGEYDEIKNNISAKEAHIMGLENIILNLETNVMKLKDEIDRLQFEATEKCRLFENLRSEKQDLEKDNVEMTCKIQVGIDEVQKVQKELQELQDYHASLENSNKRHIDEKAMLEADIQRLREELSSLQMEHDELKIEVSSKSLHLVKLESEKNNMQVQWNKIEKEKVELLKFVKDQKCVHEVEIKNREMLFSNLQEKCEIDRMEKERVETQIFEIERKVAALEDLNGNLRRETSLLEEEKHALQLEASVKLVCMNKLEDQINMHVNNEEKLQEEKKNLLHENHDLKAQVHANQEKFEEKIHSLQISLTSSQAEYEQSLVTQNSYTVKIEELENVISQMVMDRNKLDEVVSSKLHEIQKLEDENKSLQNDILSGNEKMNILQEEVYHLQEDKENLQHIFQIKAEEVLELEIQIKELKEKLQKLQEYCSSLDNSHKRSIDEKTILEGVTKNAHDKLHSLQMEYDILKSISSNKDLRIESLEAEGSNIQEHLDQVVQEKESIIQEKETIIQKHEEKMEAMHDSYEFRIHELQTSVSQIQMESRKLKELVSSKLQEIQVLEDENTSLRSDIKSNTEQMIMLQKDIHEEQLRMELSSKALQDENTSLRSDIKSNNEQMIMLQKDIHEEQLRMELSSKELHEKLQNLEEQYTNLYNSHILSVDENRTLEAVINSAREEISTLQIAHDALKAEMSTKDMLFVELEKEQKNLQEHMDKMAQEKESVIEKHEEEIGKLKVAQDSYTSIIHDLQDSVSHIQLEKHRLDEVILSKSQAIQVLKNQNKALQDDIHAQHEQMAMLQQEIHCLQEEKTKSEEMLQVKSQQLLELEATVKSLEEKLHNLQECYSSLDNSQKRSIDEKTILEDVIKNAREELSALQIVHDALKTEMSARDLQILSLKEGSNSLQGHLDQVIQEKKSIIQRHEEEITKQKATQISYQSRLDELHNAFSQVQMEKHNLDGIVLSKLQEIQNLQDENKSFRDDIQSANEQIDELQKEIHCLQEDGKNFQQMLQAKTDQLFDLQIKGKELQEELQKSQEYCSNLDDSYKQIIEEKNVLEEITKKAKENLSSLKVEYDALKIKMSATELRLQEQIQNLQLKTQTEIEEHKKRTEELRSELANLHHQVVILKEDNKKQKQDLGIIAEQKREAIRQLCFSLEYLKAKNKKLEETLRSFKVQLRIKYTNSPSTWRSYLAPWYKPSREQYLEVQ